MINCEKCNTPVDERHINTGEFVPCGRCGALIRTEVFPAAVRTADTEQAQENLVIEDDAGCFYHPTKKAVVPCASCGRFLCALCDIEMDNAHICFSCLESGKKKKKLDTLETHRFLPDSLALRLSIFPLVSVIFTGFTWITAPAAIYLVIRHWKSETSIVPRGRRWRFITAFILSSAQVVGWITILFLIINQP